MKVLVVGNGAREHAIVWKLAQSPKIKEIYVAPGNAGTDTIAYNIPINATDIPGLINFARQTHVDFTLIGPEIPLAEGIVDQFNTSGMAIFGPTKAASSIESSKVFAKELMRKYHIPSADSRSFDSYIEARAYLEKQKPPLVIKADGLAAGKGVTVAQTLHEALEALKSIMLDKVFGASGEKVVIEEYLAGREMSVFAFSDARTVVPMVPACDYKRIFDGNGGPNTGGMGSYSPPEFYTGELGEQIFRTIMGPTIRAMYAEGTPYRGVLYGGLIIARDGPRVIEFNSRFGDPETQVVMPRLRTDLVDIVLAVINQNLGNIKVEWSQDPCVGVVLVSGGYPGVYKTGLPISGLNDLDEDIMLFHAGTKKADNGQVLTAGGRVLTLVATGKTLASAREKVYNNISRISFEGSYYRKDIALF